MNKKPRLSRRELLGHAMVVGLSATTAVALSRCAPPAPEVASTGGTNGPVANIKGPISANQALQKLLDGNRRYVAARIAHPDQTVERRAQLAKGQHPFAVILGCADSCVPPEIIFDQGLGDLLVVRVAGNIVDDVATGSIEYAAEHLGARLIMVLGHERCGVVQPQSML